jgi:hypothetical protein
MPDNDSGIVPRLARGGEGRADGQKNRKAREDYHPSGIEKANCV